VTERETATEDTLGKFAGAYATGEGEKPNWHSNEAKTIKRKGKPKREKPAMVVLQRKGGGVAVRKKRKKEMQLREEISSRQQWGTHKVRNQEEGQR